MNVQDLTRLFVELPTRSGWAIEVTSTRRHFDPQCRIVVVTATYDGEKIGALEVDHEQWLAAIAKTGQ